MKSKRGAKGSSDLLSKYLKQKGKIRFKTKRFLCPGSLSASTSQLSFLSTGPPSPGKTAPMQWKHQIPELYRRLLAPELLAADLHESKATCDDCAMTRERRGARARITYQGHLKCCTFEPFLPNFLVGALLLEEERFPYGVDRIRHKIATREGALPIGLVPRLAFQVEFNSREPGDFGQREDWLCPYYHKDSQNCGVWKYRGAVCTTFYCQSDTGRAGQRLWVKVSDYLSEAEIALTEEVAGLLGFSPSQVSDCLEYVNRFEATESEMATPGIPLNEWRGLWDGRHNEIEDYYKRCYEEALKFDRGRYLESVGEPGQKREAKMLAQLERVLALRKKK